MPSTRKPSADAPPDPDRLVRQSAGVYRSGDGRFEVRQSDAAWYLVDVERINDFGQELIHGPFATLNQARAAIPGARKVEQLRRPKLPAAAMAKKAPVAPAKPPPRPKSWIDRLPAEEAKAVRRVISALEHVGVAEAEDWVRDSRKAGGRNLAARLVEHRLAALVDDAAPTDRRGTRELVRRVVEALAEDGTLTSPPLPRWALVELDAAEPLPPGRLRPKVP